MSILNRLAMSLSNSEQLCLCNSVTLKYLNHGSQLQVEGIGSGQPVQEFIQKLKQHGLSLKQDSDKYILDIADVNDVDEVDLGNRNSISLNLSENAFARFSTLPDVVLVGAGPVGLMTAIQTKLRNPNAKIRMVERNREYTRNHVLRIDPSSYKDAHPDFKNLCHDLVGEVHTSKIEQTLLNKARELDIDIVYAKVEDVKSFCRDYPKFTIIVGADGSRSQVRDKVFGEKNAEHLRFTAQLSYEVDGKSCYLDNLKQAYPLRKKIPFFITEHVKYNKSTNRTRVTLRLFTDEDTFRVIINAKDQPVNAKNPLKFFTELNGVISTNQYGNQLGEVHDAFVKWMTRRNQYLGDQLFRDTANLTVIQLDVYHSPRYAGYKEDRLVFLVGDAAIGVPFFRALNNGMLCATQLSKSLAKLANNKSGHVSMIEKYNQFCQGRFNREAASAHVKDTGLTSVEKYVRVSNVVPWQIFRDYEPETNDDASNADELSASQQAIEEVIHARSIGQILQINHSIDKTYTRDHAMQYFADNIRNKLGEAGEDIAAQLDAIAKTYDKIIKDEITFALRTGKASFLPQYSSQSRDNTMDVLKALYLKLLNEEVCDPNKPLEDKKELVQKCLDQHKDSMLNHHRSTIRLPFADTKMLTTVKTIAQFVDAATNNEQLNVRFNTREFRLNKCSVRH